jgi:hypothetical protein
MHFQPSRHLREPREEHTQVTSLGIVVLTGRASDLEAFSPYPRDVASQHRLIKRLYMPVVPNTSSSRTTVLYHHNDIVLMYLLLFSL